MTSPTHLDPIPYHRRDRSTDRRQGRRDGRRQIPAFSSLMEHIEAATRITAPYPEKLARIGQYEMNGEYIAYQRRTEAWRQRVASARAQIEATELGIQRGVDEIAAARAELTPEEVMPRSPQERRADGVVLRSRREAVRERRIAAAEAAQRERIALIDALKRQIAEAEEAIAREFAIAQARVRRLGDYYAVREATYWQGVALSHPEGRQLALLLPYISSIVPPWARPGPESLPQHDLANEPLEGSVETP